MKRIEPQAKASFSNTNRIFPITLALFLPAMGIGCAQTGHGVMPASLHAQGALETGKPKSQRHWQDMVALMEEHGPVVFEKFTAADWVVDRSGLINLHHHKAEAAQLEDGPEAIQIYFYVIEHPIHGAFMIDSGIAESVAQQDENMPVRWPVQSAMHLDELKVHLNTKTYMESRTTPLGGVFLTHLHPDHILGLQDIPKETPIFVGPGETEDRRFTHLFVRPTTDLNLEGFGSLKEWQVQHEEGAPFDFVDIFGDGSALGLHIPGHTKGSMAFLVRTTKGPVLMVGDGSHTTWGWENGVEPGTFNTDGEQAADSLAKLRVFAAAHPTMEVHLGHQSLGDDNIAMRRTNWPSSAPIYR